jgi:hypothetical protein
MHATSLVWTCLTSPDPFALSLNPFVLIREFNRQRAPLVRRRLQGRTTSTVSSLPVYRWAGHFSRWSTGEEQYLEKPISVECAAPHALSNKRNRTAKAFQTAELSITECDVFKFFHSPPHLEPEMEMTQVDFFYPVWFSWLLDGWSILCT